MAPRTQYDLDSFRILVKSGKNKSEIMGELAIKNTATFSNTPDEFDLFYHNSVEHSYKPESNK